MDAVISRFIPAAAVIAALALSGCGATQHATLRHAISRVASPSRAPSEYVDRDYAYRVRVPAGWWRARQSLTPHLLDPREILTAATFPLRLHGGPCAQNPGALADMGPRDVLVTVQERAGTRGPEFVARPRRFTAGMGVPSEATGCVRHPTFSARLIDFRDGPRFFLAIVAIGKSAPADARRAAFAMLDSLHFGLYRPRWQPAASAGATTMTKASAPGSFASALRPQAAWLALPTGRSSAHFRITAPSPARYDFDVALNLPAAAHVVVQFRTWYGAALDVLDYRPGEQTESSTVNNSDTGCKLAKSRVLCVQHYPLLEAQKAGAWTVVVSKRSVPPAAVRVVVTFHNP
jgi:hypothetical protein